VLSGSKEAARSPGSFCSEATFLSLKSFLGLPTARVAGCPTGHNLLSASFDASRGL
jgi:hypothetical protein